MHLIHAIVHNPVKVAVGVLLMALFGIVAMLTMPMQLTPEVQTPTISIRTAWRGASPQEIEREIIQPQEEQLKGVENARKLTSQCRDSEGTVEIEFAVGTNIEAALVRVNRRLQQVREYPEDADEPVLSTSSPGSRAIAWFILSVRPPSVEQLREYQQTYPQHKQIFDSLLQADSAGLVLRRLRQAAEEFPELAPLLPTDVDVPKWRRFAEDVIEARFERVSGVSDANVMGGREEELQVLIDPQRLSARQITVNDLRLALQRQNADTSGGDFWEGKRRYVVRTLGQFRSLDDVANEIIAVRDGAPVYVSDVAEVRMGHKKPDGIVRRYGDSTIAISAERETGANVLEVMKGLREAVVQLNDGPLKRNGLIISQVYDETEYIYSAIGLVGENIVVGGLLTIAVLLLFLRSGRSTLVIALAIPSSIVGTFLMLSVLGRSLNVISLAGLAFAVGMLVDNAVVVLENIYRHCQEGEAPFQAAIKATQEVWGAVVASTLTTLAVFVPILFVQQEAGQLFSDIALAISFAVGLSLIISVTVIPTASARLFVNTQQVANEVSANRPARSGLIGTLLDRTFRFGSGFVGSVVGINRWIQHSTWRRLGVVLSIVVLAVGGTTLLWPDMEYLPTGNRNLAFGIILPPPGYNLDQLMELGEVVDDHLRPYWDYDPATVDASKLKYPLIKDFFFVARGRQVFMGLRAVEATEVAKLVPALREVGGKLPGAIVVASQSSLFERGLGAGRGIEVEITGEELPKLVQLGGQVMRSVMELIPTAQARPEPSLDLSSPEIHIIPKQLQTAELGVSNQQLGYVVDALVDGAYATDYFLGGDKVDLTIMGHRATLDNGEESFRALTQDLDALPVATPSGQLVTLSDLAEIRLASGPEQINHRERRRAITITVSPPDTMALEEAIAIIRQDIIQPLQDSGQIGGEYQITLSGTADKLTETWKALRWNLVLAVLITYLLMAALFESWLYPFVIILCVPLGAVGGVAALRLLSVYLVWLGQPPQMLDVLTMLGFVILIGTVVNNPILIVHQTLNHIREDQMSVQEALLSSVATRIRPIFMTTTTTLFGLAPLVFFPGAGSELYRGLGSVVLGGLLISTLFTLILVPTLFTLTMDFKSAVIRYWRGDNGTSSGDGSVRIAVGESQASSASVDNSPTVAPRSSLQS
ncbi:MAG: efflux RND transporter permease subunit [Planctomycetales bacterium]|nr:efflux RND transporter permease subunit [Planctomycetales bacterium]